MIAADEQCSKQGRPGNHFIGIGAVADDIPQIPDDIVCREGRDTRLQRVDIRSARADDRPGRNDSIIGEATGRRGFSSQDFTFFCRVDFSSGRVRSVDVTPRR